MVSVFQLIGRIIAKKLSEKRWFNPLSLTRKGFTDLKEAGVNRKWRSLLVASTAACIPVYNEVTDGHSYTVEYIVVQVEYGNRRTRKYKKWAKPESTEDESDWSSEIYSSCSRPKVRSPIDPIPFVNAVLIHGAVLVPPCQLKRNATVIHVRKSVLLLNK